MAVLLTIEPLENERQGEDILRSCKILRTDEKGRAEKEERPKAMQYPPKDDGKVGMDIFRKNASFKEGQGR